jgi:hypothetical protein
MGFSSTVDGKWSASSNATSWLKVALEGAGGIRLTLAVNTGAARSGLITVKCGTASATFAVTQAAAKSLSVSRTTWKAPAAADSTTAKITTNQGVWTADADVGWLFFAPGSGVTGDALTIVTLPNPGPRQRTAHVTVTSGDGSDRSTATITITQASP